MILASKSPRRRELMEDAGYDFRCIPGDFDESSVQTEDPYALPELLARGKALAAASEAEPGEVVVGSDTVVLLEGQILGKPRDAEDAARMLRALSGKAHEVVTGVALVRDGEVAKSFSDVARVVFWDLTEDDIAWYLATGEPFDKAGAYGIQGKGRLLVKGIEGDFYTVMGLPISRVYREIAAL